MKKISEKVYEADEGKIIVSKVTKAKYKKIFLSQNDSIDKYEEISDIPSSKEAPKEKERSPIDVPKKWGKSE